MFDFDEVVNWSSKIPFLQKIKEHSSIQLDDKTSIPPGFSTAKRITGLPHQPRQLANAPPPCKGGGAPRKKFKSRKLEFLRHSIALFKHIVL